MLASLVQLPSDSDDLSLDLRLAGSDNFTGRPIYKKPTACLHRDAAEKLDIAIRGAKRLGLRLHVWDVFRPLEAQQKLWDHHPDARYISHPENGPRTHCRAIAIDLNLAERKSGNLLDMGTGFDDFRDLGPSQ